MIVRVSEVLNRTVVTVNAFPQPTLQSQIELYHSS